MQVRILHTESPRIPGEGSSALGKSGPKARLKSVVDGKQVDIPVPAHRVMEGQRRLTGPVNGFRTKRGRRQSGKSGCQSEGVMGSERREPSSEDGDASFQEKLLALIDERPVPKPTQVVKARSLR